MPKITQLIENQLASSLIKNVGLYPNKFLLTRSNFVLTGGSGTLEELLEAIHEIPKVVFSHTLNHLEWENSILAKKALQDEVLTLKQIADRDFFVGSPGLIISLMNLNLVDELQICVHPVVAGSGRLLFNNIQERNALKLVKTKIFSSGAIILYYEPIYAQGL